MIAAFLIRCSTKKQDYQRQVNDLTRLAKRLGYDYSEDTTYGEHITGKDDATIRDRESIARLKEDAQAEKFQVVLVSEVSRMSRDSVSGRWYVRELVNWGIPVYFKDIDTWTFEPNTKQIPSKIKEKEAVIGAAFDAAWKYLKSMKTQIASGRRNELDNNCISVGKPFFGYKRRGGKDKSTKNQLIIDDYASKIVVDIFNEYIKDDSTLKSTALAITSKYGKNFSQGTINHILNYESYATGVKIYTLKDPDIEEIDRFEIKLPTIIPLELYKTVQAKKKSNRTTPYPNQTVYLLSKLIKCAECGYSLTPRKKEYLTWTCMAGVNNTTNCKTRISINNDKIEPIIWQLLKIELISFSKIDDKQQKMKDLNDKISDLEGRIDHYQTSIDSQKALINRAYKAYTNAPEDILEQVQADYYNTISKCNKEIKSNESAINGFKDEINRIKSLLQYYSNVHSTVIDESDFNLKRKLVTELIYKIIPHRITTYKTRHILKNGVLVLEVHTINGIYYVLYNANEGKYAYYLGADIIYSGSSFADDYVKSLGSEVFYTPYYNKEIIDVNEFKKLAIEENNIIDIKKG